MLTELVHTGINGLPTWVTNFQAAYQQWIESQKSLSNCNSCDVNTYIGQLGFRFTYTLRREVLPGIGPFPKHDAWEFAWPTEEDKTMFMLRFL
jgi:hypothetical protein